MRPERLNVAAIAPGMSAPARHTRPGVLATEGAAGLLPQRVPAEWLGRIGAAWCIPLLPVREQWRFIGAAQQVAPAAVSAVRLRDRPALPACRGAA
jgi:hypothetical protein